MQVSEVLKAAKDLIKDPAKWTQGAYQNEAGCLCSLGAIARAANLPNCDIDRHPAAKLLLKVVEWNVPKFHNFAYFNDDHTHTEVMEAFDKAIYTASVQEGEVVKL